MMGDMQMLSLEEVPLLCVVLCRIQSGNGVARRNVPGS
jgi:hypothetical protein